MSKEKDISSFNKNYFFVILMLSVNFKPKGQSGPHQQDNLSLITIMKYYKLLLTTACLMASIASANAFVHVRQLHSDWRFRQGDSEIWHEAQVPGNVHLDLMHAHIIDDPFYRLNERSVQWVDKADWMYETNVVPTAEELQAQNQEIVFKGLDTYADVYLNGRLLVRTDNMHREWRCDVKGILQEGNNRFEVYFHSPIRRNIPKFDALPYRHNTGPDQSWIGGIFDKVISPFARTASYEYGWDWGPRLVTFGIWRSVQLETWNGEKIANVWHIQNEVNSRRAKLTTVVEVESDEDVTAAIVAVSANDKQLASRTISLVKGLNKIRLDYAMDRPRLWWTNGLGEAYLYNFKTTISTAGKIVDSTTDEIGIRSLKLHNDKDKYGHNLYFELNGQPLYAKGSNMVPNDNFLSRCNDSVYHRVVQDAKAVNMNIIRVWGGGVYEDDAFYRECDRNGILVWQDFMFACCTYPADSAFLANVKEEAVYQVRRLRNRACLAVLVGNNECQDVWYGWGNKKKQLDEMGYGEEVGKMQHALFHELLPSVVKEYAPQISYRPSSPYAFENTPSDGINGDDHYWGVWHGAEPFEAYYDHRVRFQSEYGFQSFPEYESVLKYAPFDYDHNIYSEVMMEHQKAGTYANHRIEEYMRRDYHVPSDFKKFLYVSLLMQGDGVKTGMEAYRRDRPYCMGSIVWQLNDCWPVASWSSRDYYGRWKALHYFTKYAYDDILVAPRVKVIGEGKKQEGKQVSNLPTEAGGQLRVADNATSRSDKEIEIKLVSDRRTVAKGELTIQTMTMDGRIVHSERRTVVMPANTAIHVETKLVKDLLGGEQPEDVIFYIAFTTGGKTYSNIAYAVSQKDMNYRPARMKTVITKAADGYDVKLSSEVFARGVFLSVKGIGNFFSDNYFDLLPKTSRTIHVRCAKDLDTFKKELEIISLVDTY